MSERNLTGKKGLENKYSKSERQGPTSKITLFSKAIIKNGRSDKVLPRQGKLKEFTITKPLLYEMLKVTI